MEGQGGGTGEPHSRRAARRGEGVVQAQDARHMGGGDLARAAGGEGVGAYPVVGPERSQGDLGGNVDDRTSDLTAAALRQGGAHRVAQHRDGRRFHAVQCRREGRLVRVEAVPAQWGDGRPEHCGEPDGFADPGGAGDGRGP